jgi:hypothetical protein
MNLAARDVRHHSGRFALTTVGVSMLLMIVMGMGGIYRGLVFEATLLINRLGADLWVVQAGTRGPFAEISRVPMNMVDRVAAVPGVACTHEFVYVTIQRQRDGLPLRMAVLGLDWPSDKGEWLPLSAGRSLAQAQGSGTHHLGDKFTPADLVVDNSDRCKPQPIHDAGESSSHQNDFGKQPQSTGQLARSTLVRGV